MKKRLKVIIIVAIALIVAIGATLGTLYLVEKKQLEEAITEKTRSLSEMEWVASAFNMSHHYIYADGSIGWVRIYNPSPSQYEELLHTEIVLNPVSGTYEVIENVNMYIKINNIDMGKYDLPQTLTLEIIKDNPDKMYKLIYEDIYSIEFDRYGTETRASISLSNIVGAGHLPPEILFGDE